jgi:radical SAM protein with 4Fe4S-binding SPASM domain
VVRSGWGLYQATEHLRSLPVDVIKAQAVRGFVGAPYTLTGKEIQAYLEDLEAIGSRVIAELEAGQMPRDDRFSSLVLQLLKGEKRQAFCAAGDSTFGIAPSGDVLPCILLDPKGNILGHVNDDPKSWRKAGYHWKTSRPLRSECRACSYFYMCGGGCPALMPVCGTEECTIIRKNCDVARSIFEHFRSTPEVLLGLVGIF